MQLLLVCDGQFCPNFRNNNWVTLFHRADSQSVRIGPLPGVVHCTTECLPGKVESKGKVIFFEEFLENARAILRRNLKDKS